MTFTHPNFNILRELGRGGNATVYLAVQLSLNRRVALKVMHGGAWMNAQQKARFLREGRIVAKLNHPNIVPVYEVDEVPDDADSLFMVMEYLPAGTLTQQVEQMTLADLARTTEQICAALAFSHERGIVHRDVKPDNVLFRDASTALLGDFGIARAADSLTQMTVTGTLMGTPDYMSPEQVAGSALDARSDLYSLGVLLFELLAGYRPIEGDNVMSTGLSHLTVAPRPLPENVAACQPFIERLLAKQADDRFATAAEVAAAFEDALDGMRIDSATPLVDLYSGIKPERVAINTLMTTQGDPRARSKASWWMGGLAAAVVATGVGVAVFNEVNQVTPAQSEPPSEIERPPEPTPLALALEAADEAFRLDRWFGNDDSDAVPMYRKALSLDPQNALARQRLDAMLDASLARVAQVIQQGDAAVARQQIESLETVWPEEARVDALRETLSDAERARSARLAANRRAAQVQTLIDQASTAQAQGRWLAQDGTGALQRYSAALELDPDNRLARTGRAQVLSSLEAEIEDEMAEGAFERAEQKFEAARIALSDLALDRPSLLELGDRIASARAAANERARQSAVAAALSSDIERYMNDARTWLRDDSSQPDERYRALTRDLNALLARAPENERLLAIQIQLETRASQITEANRRASTPEETETIQPPVTF